MKVFHIITGLNNGGAEATLFKLATNDINNEHIVISMMDLGFYGSRLIDAGVQVETLNMDRGRLSFNGVSKLYRFLKVNKPDVIQTWMYHADLIGGITAKLAGFNNILWNLRHSNLNKNVNSKSTLIIAKLCSIFSYSVPKTIVSCSNASTEAHIKYGYAKNKIVFIPNGYDPSILLNDDISGKEFRSEWNISTHEKLVGMVGRWDSQKDHHNLLAALSYVKDTSNNWKCMLIGPGMNNENNELMRLIASFSLQNHILLLGATKNIPKIMSGLDIHILSSAGEAFPNVVAEAMACETPCVVTDVGDAKLIVGSTGWVVPSKSPDLLAEAILEAFKCIQDGTQWQLRRRQCRNRILETFTIDKMIESYNKAWLQVFSKGNS